MESKKEIRDIALTIGAIGIFTVSVLFFFTLFTALKIGKFSLIILLISGLLVSYGLSQKNRIRLKSILFTKTTLSS